MVFEIRCDFLKRNSKDIPDKARFLTSSFGKD